MKKKVVIVGAEIAGRNVARRLAEKNKGFEIILIKKEKNNSYSPCGMPHVLAGEVPGMKDLLFPDFDKRLQKYGIKLEFGITITKIDIENKFVEFDKGSSINPTTEKTSQVSEGCHRQPVSNRVNYDILVIATGRKPFIPPISGVKLKQIYPATPHKGGVYTLTKFADGMELSKAIENNIEKAVIIGAGFIGMETACAFSKRGIKTKVVELKPYILSQLLDPDMASIVESRLKKSGIDIFTGTEVKALNGKNKVETVTLDNGEKISADLVLIAAGIRPNVDLAKDAGIEIGKTGGIVTDNSQRAKRNGEFLNNVFALGDCVESTNFITGSLQSSPLVTTAVIQSKIVAENICGNKIFKNDYLAPAIAKIGQLEIGSVGILTNQAENNGVNIKTAKAKGRTKEKYHPGYKEMTVKLLASQDRLVGAQIICEQDVKERINFITAIIQKRMKISDILYMERCYTPSICTIPDAFTRAIEKLK